MSRRNQYLSFQPHLEWTRKKHKNIDNNHCNKLEVKTKQNLMLNRRRDTVIKTLNTPQPYVATHHEVCVAANESNGYIVSSRQHISDAFDW